MATKVGKVEFPAKLRFLFKKYRYKVAYGGRGSAKSWSFARALLILGAKEKLRILCTREVQNSIKDSVHKLLSDQIEELGLSDRYDILDTEIRGKNGTEFIFSGLSSHTVTSIKSYEGVDICWIEEAQSVSEGSWNILIPTIRKGGSEIWISFNPDLESDDTYRRFVKSPLPNAVVVHVNYNDNPWFSSELEDERKLAKLTMSQEDYGNIWEGKCRKSASGAIYSTEISLTEENRRIRPVPYDPLLSVHCIWDLGWNDMMTIIMVQRVGSEIRVIDYIEESHKTLDWYVSEMKLKRYNFGTDWIPHDGEHKNYQTGKSTKEILEALGRKVEITPNISVEEGIKVARMTFGRVFFDEEKTLRLVECLRRYRRSINAQTREPGAPMHDEFSHGADAFRYLSIVADRLPSSGSTNRAHPSTQAASRRHVPPTRAGY